MVRSRSFEAEPSMADNLESAAAKGLIPRRHDPLTVTEAVDTAAVVVGAASFASAAGAVLWWHRRRTR
jgi:hypothetical protein